MKFIYTLGKCKIFIYIHVSVNVEYKTYKCKNKNIYTILHNPNVNIYIYMILHGYVKQCKYVTMYKMWILLEEARFHNVFEDKPAKWPIAKTKPSQYPPHQFIWLCKKVWSLKIYNKIICKIRKTTLEP